MTATTRLDIDLAFSLVEPSLPPSTAADQTAAGAAVPSPTVETMSGTVKAAGLDVEIFAGKPELFVSRAVRLKDLRRIAADLADRGLTVSLSGPNGLVVRVGAVTSPPLQRVLTGSSHIVLGSRAALTPLLRRRSRRRGAPPLPTVPLPPSTLFPLVPTFDRRIRRRITTTHYAPGAGRPRLVFVVGSENWNGQAPREFDLLPGVTTIGSGPDCDLRLDGLQPLHAEIRHDRNDEYVLFPLGPVAGGTKQEVRPHGGGQILRTGARIEMGPWRMAFFREEYADHGRPFGGRLGGELAVQRPQPARPAAPPEHTGAARSGTGASSAQQERDARPDLAGRLDDSEI